VDTKEAVLANTWAWESVGLSHSKIQLFPHSKTNQKLDIGLERASKTEFAILLFAFETGRNKPSRSPCGVIEQRSGWCPIGEGTTSTPPCLLLLPRTVRLCR
jgi:hypothetical protein